MKLHTAFAAFFFLSFLAGVNAGSAPQVNVLFLFFAFFVGAIMTFILSRYAPNLPYTVVLFVTGALFSGIFSLVDENNILRQSIDSWNSINPELILYVFLPALVFSESMSLNFHHVRSVLLPSAIMAIPVALLGMVGFAAAIHSLLPYNWTWTLSLLFSAITCATDPMAVVPLLKKSGASHRLTYLITGEALIKDATALAVYHLLYIRIHNNADQLIDASYVVFYIVRVLCISPLLGILFGLITSFTLLLTHNRLKEEDTIVQMAMTMCCAYISFFVAEDMLGVSGVLACCAAGVTLCRFAKPLYLQPEAINAIWSAAEWIANTMIFLLSGLLIGARTIIYVNAQDWLYLLAIYGILNGVRFLCFGLAHPIIAFTLDGYEMKEGVFASWIGLRGAVSMVLALSVSEAILLEETIIDTSEAHRIFFYVGGLASLSLLLNATTATYLLKAFGLANDTSVSVEAKIIFQFVKKRMKLKALKLLEDIQTNCSDDTYFIDINIVVKYCRILRDDDSEFVEEQDELQDILLAPSSKKFHHTDNLLIPQEEMVSQNERRNRHARFGSSKQPLITSVASSDLLDCPIPEHNSLKETDAETTMLSTKRSSKKTAKKSRKQILKQQKSLSLSGFVDQEVDDDEDENLDDESDAFNSENDRQVHDEIMHHRHHLSEAEVFTKYPGSQSNSSVTASPMNRSRPVSRQLNPSANNNCCFHSLVQDQLHKLRSVDTVRRSFAVQKCISTDNLIQAMNAAAMNVQCGESQHGHPLQSQNSLFGGPISRISSMDAFHMNPQLNHIVGNSPLRVGSPGSPSHKRRRNNNRSVLLQNMFSNNNSFLLVDNTNNNFNRIPFKRQLSDVLKSGKFVTSSRKLSNETSAKIVPTNVSLSGDEDARSPRMHGAIETQAMEALSSKKLSKNSSVSMIMTKESLTAAMDAHLSQSSRLGNVCQLKNQISDMTHFLEDHDHEEPETTILNSGIQMVPTVLRNSWIGEREQLLIAEKKSLQKKQDQEIVDDNSPHNKAAVNAPKQTNFERGLEPDLHVVTSPFLVSPSPASPRLTVDHHHHSYNQNINNRSNNNGRHAERKEEEDNDAAAALLLANYTQTQIDLSKFPRKSISIDLLFQIRKAFLDMVRVNYWRQIHSGKLPRESPAILILLNSTDHGLDRIMSADGFVDWEYIERTCRELFDDPDSLRPIHSQQNSPIQEQQSVPDPNTSWLDWGSSWFRSTSQKVNAVIQHSPVVQAVHHHAHPHGHDPHNYELEAPIVAPAQPLNNYGDEIDLEQGNLSPNESNKIVTIPLYQAPVVAGETNNNKNTATNTATNSRKSNKRLPPQRRTSWWDFSDSATAASVKQPATAASSSSLSTFLPLVRSIIREHQAAVWITILTSFIEAHEYAQHKIPFYLGETEEIDTIEEAIVIEESKALTNYVKTILLQLDPQLIIQQVSKQTAYWILHSQQDQIEEFTNEGILTENDAAELLHEIEADLSVLLYCAARNSREALIEQWEQQVAPSPIKHQQQQEQGRWLSLNSEKQPYSSLKQRIANPNNNNSNNNNQNPKDTSDENKYHHPPHRRHSKQSHTKKSSFSLQQWIVQHELVYTCFHYFILLGWHASHRIRLIGQQIIYYVYLMVWGYPVYCSYLLYDNFLLRCCSSPADDDNDNASNLKSKPLPKAKQHPIQTI